MSIWTKETPGQHRTRVFGNGIEVCYETFLKLLISPTLAVGQCVHDLNLDQILLAVFWL